MPPLHPPALASGSPAPYLCQYNLCSVQSASLHNKLPSPRPGSLCLEGRGREGLGPWLLSSGEPGTRSPRVNPQRALSIRLGTSIYHFLGWGNGGLHPLTQGAAPRETAQAGENRSLPPSLLHGPWGPCWSQEATKTALGAPGAASLGFLVPSIMGRGPEGARPGLPSLSLTLGFTWGPSHCLHWAQGAGWGVRACPVHPMAQRIQQARSCSPSAKPAAESHLRLCSREECAGGVGWGGM